jgi:serine/threonine protein kinase/TolB-like protein
MTPARFQTIEQIYREALEQEPGQISTFLNRACKGDVLLRHKVEALLNSRPQAYRFIENSAVGLANKILENQQTGSLVGQTIGHYKISEPIGTGGMGEVYLATDVVAGRKAALKLLPVQFTHDPDRLKRFQQEAHAVVALNHPNILTVYEIGEDQSIHYIASELIEGETLRQRLTREPMQLSEALDVTIQVAGALAVAHHAGIVHRDIKPENIMLRPDGYVKVLDFGIAKLAEHELPTSMPKDEALLLVQTNLGSILGTVRYMSPEQVRGAQVDKRTDIWSLGVVLYEMVAGHEPFNGDTAREVMSSILETEPPPLTSYVSQTPAELQEMISKTLRKDRDERYGNAHEMLEALKNLRRKLEFKGMPPEVKQEIELEIAHVLLTDIVGYSKLPVDEQRALIERLNEIVRGTDEFKAAEGAGRLIKIPTGDGIALVFYSRPEAPLECAVQISRSLKEHPQLQLRMGIHSGPVSGVIDVNERANVAGSGMNVAQRVMDCGDAGHILISKHAAEDLEQYGRWRPYLHALGEVEVKHGIELSIFNFYTDEVGNPQLPEKIRRVRARRKAAVLLVVGVSLGVLLSGGLLIWGYQSGHKTINASVATLPAILEKSIAVLPFENLSKDEENAFFAGGVQDEILTDLAKIADLKVISRTSVMKYKSGLERNLREIANTLGVSHVVEGSVQRAAGRVRVNVQLIDARNDAHVWAEHYDRDVADIFAIQSEIAQQIADQLRAKLSAAEKAAIVERPTTDLVAYAYYTKAKEMDMLTNWEGDEINLNQKVELLEKATQRDPKFALAYCELAKTHVDLSSFTGEAEVHKDLALAKNAAEAALRVRPDLGEAHLELARYYFYAGVFTNDYDRAREELTIVRRKLPNNAEALVIEAMIGRHENRWDASLANLQRASELDPRNSDVAFRLRQIYFEMRRYSELEQSLTRAGASGIFDHPFVQFWLARIKLAQGDPVAAQSLLQQVPLDYSPGPWIWGARFTAALYLRDYDAANGVIAATPAKWAEIAFSEAGSDWAYGQIARAHGDKEKALAAFAAARNKVEARSADKPEDAAYLAEVATLDAGLGRKEEAIREARRAVELMPIAKDSVNGPTWVADLALVYAWTGERDRALEQLEKVATIPGVLGGFVVTYGDLRFNPCWDDLRGDKRFDKIVAAAKAASR